MNVELANAQHIGAREEQQDSFGFTDPADGRTVAHAGVLGVLADGMGGLRHGSAMAQAGVRAFLDAYRSKPSYEGISEALGRSLIHANEAVFALARNLDAEGAAGATLVAAVLHTENLYWISAGDSRAYLVRDRRAFQLTVDHNYGEDHRLEAVNGEAVPDQEAVTSFLGMPMAPRVDANIRPYPLCQDDCVLLASDGLYKTIRESEIALACEQNLRDACADLIDRTVRRNVPEQDNVTVMAMAFGSRRPSRRQTRR